MAPFDVNLVCWRIVHERGFLDAVLADPAAAIADAGLTEEERAMFLAGDVRGLYELGGISGSLLEHLATYQAFGLDWSSYSERIRQAEWQPSW